MDGKNIPLIQAPGSKSYTNRALIMAALAEGPVELKNPLYSDDTEAMIRCLRILGIEVETWPDRLIVHGDICSIKEKHYELFVRESGTTARFLLALACIAPGIKIVRGSKRLNERPIKDLAEALGSLGANLCYLEEEGKFPIRISSSTLIAPRVIIKGDVSSQFCSALLLIAPQLPQGLTIQIAGALISKPYVDMTIHCMRDWGIEVREERPLYTIPPSQKYRKKEYVIEGDFSSAGYFFAIAALTQSSIAVENISPNSLQADRRFIDILVQMGNLAHYSERSVRLEGRKLAPLDLSMEDCPDQVMTLAVLAAFAKGTTVIRGVRSLRVKESERVVALQTELGKMGIDTEATEDTLIVYGGCPRAAKIETYNDHRIAMAFAVASAALPGMIICNPEVVSKTFPTFWDQLKRLL